MLKLLAVVAVVPAVEYDELIAVEFANAKQRDDALADWADALFVLHTYIKGIITNQLKRKSQTKNCQVFV